MHMIDRVTVNNAVRMTDMCIWKNDAAKKKGGWCFQLEFLSDLAESNQNLPIDVFTWRIFYYDQPFIQNMCPIAAVL